MKLLVLYFLALLVFGVRDVFRRGSYADFVAAGQNNGPFTVFMTLMATMLGASATLGVAAKAEAEGFPAMWWLGAGAAGLLLQGLALSARIRGTGARTLPELARIKVGPAAQRLVAAVVAISWPGIVAAQFAAAAGLLGAAFGVQAGPHAVLATAGVVTLYTIAGGQRSVVKTDVFQMAVLVAGFAGMFLWVFLGKGGGEAVSRASVRLFSEGTGVRDAAVLMLTVGGAYFLGPDITSRAFVAKDGAAARKAVLWAAPALLLFGIGVTLVGMWAARNVPGDGNPLFRISGKLPVAVAALLSLGLISALVSSADTCLVNPAAIVVNDILGIRTVRATRVAVAVIGVAAAAMALRGASVIDLLLKAYSVYTPGVVCPLAVAVLAKGVRKGLWLAAVVAGGLCGLAHTIFNIGPLLPVAGMGLSLSLALASVRRRS